LATGFGGSTPGQAGQAGQLGGGGTTTGGQAVASGAAAVPAVGLSVRVGSERQPASAVAQSSAVESRRRRKMSRIDLIKWLAIFSTA
jgi:hypothetical protein